MTSLTVDQLRTLLADVPGHLPVYVHEDGSLGRNAETGLREIVTDNFGIETESFAIYVEESHEDPPGRYEDRP